MLANVIQINLTLAERVTVCALHTGNIHLLSKSLVVAEGHLGRSLVFCFVLFASFDRESDGLGGAERPIVPIWTPAAGNLVHPRQCNLIKWAC